MHADQFLHMMRIAAKYLTRRVDQVNALNVFPVPDGDTGTNMNLTLQSGVNEMVRNSGQEIDQLAIALSKGLLMGARGNSGVILSQLFRGFSKALSNAEPITANQLAVAFQRGVETAYQAVIKPVEGTVLTVARLAAEAGMKQARRTKSPLEVMKVVHTSALEALAKTPEMLPVLKETGVVDAGGQGLVYIYEGMFHALNGSEEIVEEIEISAPATTQTVHFHHQEKIDPAAIKFGYCTEFMIDLHTKRRPVSRFDERAFQQELLSFGDSLLVVADDERVKVHIHAERPGEVLNKAMQYGDLTGMKIDNMREQHAQASQQPSKEIGFLAVATGEGIAEVLRSLGVDVVLEGGQTMNPSADELAQAVAQINAKRVVILPNNKNIILTAEQVVHLTDRSVTVLETKTIPQGLAALFAYRTETDWTENQLQMETAIREVRSGEVTYAVRDTQIGELTISKGDYLGISDGKIQHVSQDVYRTTEALLTDMIDDNSEMVTIFYGSDLQPSEVEQWEKRLQELFPDQEIELHAGGQPLYYFVIAVE